VPPGTGVSFSVPGVLEDQEIILKIGAVEKHNLKVLVLTGQ
jgi:hypothetical protein